MLNVTRKPFMLIVVILCVIMLSVIMLSVIMMSVIMMTVVTPLQLHPGVNVIKLFFLFTARPNKLECIFGANLSTQV
jgi:hypothetical protein